MADQHTPKLLQSFTPAWLCDHPLGWLGCMDFGLLWPALIGDMPEPEPTQVDFIVYDPPHIYGARDPLYL